MLERSIIEKVLQTALSTGADFAEVFVEQTNRNQLSMISGEIDKALAGIDHGLGLRLWQDDRCFYTLSNDLRPDRLLTLARDAAAAVKGDPAQMSKLQRKIKVPTSHPVKILPTTVKKEQKVKKLRLASDRAKSFDPLISQTRCGLAELETRVCIANSEGLFKEDERVYSRFSIEAIASSDSEKQTGFIAPGFRRGHEWFRDLDVESLAQQAAQTAVTMLGAQLCPSGKMPVIIDNGFGGVIFHEACGHSLEATSLARNASVFQGKMGQKIASRCVTAIDDATLPHEWGSRDIDDEGTPTQKTVLIENGMLKSYLVDRHNGRKLGLESTGSARRESYRYAPTSRMSNTYIAAGEDDPESIIRDTPYGLHAKSMGGGSVDPGSGEFNFHVQEAYLIRDGKIAEPVRGATLIGKGADVLMHIDRVGNNMEMAQGMCGSISGSVPANVGQPMIRVSQMTVGGRRNG